MYFPKVLLNIVFHPQPLFDRFSDLISISFADAVDQLEENSIYLHIPNAHEEQKKKEDLKKTY